MHLVLGAENLSRSCHGASTAAHSDLPRFGHVPVKRTLLPEQLVDRTGRLKLVSFAETLAAFAISNIALSSPPVKTSFSEVQNTWLPNRHILITDQANERIIEVTLAKQIVWQYGTAGVAGNGPEQLNNPNCAELLANGHILICDENNNRAIEVTRDGEIVWQYGSGDPNISDPVSGVAFASRLKNGHTLITDSNHARIVEIDTDKNVVWEYFTNSDPNSNQRGGTGPLPTRALRLGNGNTLISDQYNHRVIEVNPDKEIVRSLGRINMLGYNTRSVADGGLNSPYDAKRIGDYTGITPPFGPGQEED